MNEIHEKLAVWARLSKECEQMKSRLLSADPAGGAQLDKRAIEAEFLALQARTAAAFKDASEAIRCNERARLAGNSLRRGGQQLALGG